MKLVPRTTPIRLALRLGLLALLLGIAAYYTPTRYILNAPGQAEDLTTLVHVPGVTPAPDGHLYMTTVIYERANVLFCLYALMDRSAQLLPEQYTPFYRPKGPHKPGELPDPYSPEKMMEQSKYIARVEALRYLGYSIAIESKGVRVLGFLEGAPAASKLQRDDIVTGMDGKPVRSVRALHGVLAGLKGGARVKLRVQRGKETLSIGVPLLDVHGRALIGIMTQDAVDPVELPVAVDINTHNVNGASAGLMFTLEIIDQMTGGQISRGRKIAGTGTMNLHGEVGAIEGVQLKRVAAERAGAAIFLVPDDNANEAMLGEPSPMQIISVRTLKEAVKALGGPEPRKTPLPVPR